MEQPSFACGMCGECFIDADKCRLHIQSHTGNKSFPCIICWPLFYDMPGVSGNKGKPQPSSSAAASAQKTSGDAETQTDRRQPVASAVVPVTTKKTGDAETQTDADEGDAATGGDTSRGDCSMKNKSLVLNLPSCAFGDGFSEAPLTVDVAANEEIIGHAHVEASQIDVVTTSNEKHLKEIGGIKNACNVQVKDSCSTAKSSVTNKAKDSKCTATTNLTNPRLSKMYTEKYVPCENSFIKKDSNPDAHRSSEFSQGTFDWTSSLKSSNEEFSKDTDFSVKRSLSAERLSYNRHKKGFPEQTLSYDEKCDIETKTRKRFLRSEVCRPTSNEQNSVSISDCTRISPDYREKKKEGKSRKNVDAGLGTRDSDQQNLEAAIEKDHKYSCQPSECVGKANDHEVAGTAPQVQKQVSVQTSFEDEDSSSDTHSRAYSEMVVQSTRKQTDALGAAREDKKVEKMSRNAKGPRLPKKEDLQDVCADDDYGNSKTSRSGTRFHSISDSTAIPDSTTNPVSEKEADADNPFQHFKRENDKIAASASKEHSTTFSERTLKLQSRARQEIKHKKRGKRHRAKSKIKPQMPVAMTSDQVASPDIFTESVAEAVKRSEARRKSMASPTPNEKQSTEDTDTMKMVPMDEDDGTETENSHEDVHESTENSVCFESASPSAASRDVCSNVCNKCGVQFKTFILYMRHKKKCQVRVTKKNFNRKCDYCGKYFSTVYNMHRHMVNIHAGSVQKTEVESRVMSDVGQNDASGSCVGEKRSLKIKAHKEQAAKSVVKKCHVCGKSVRGCRSLLAHLRTHRKRQHCCFVCNRTFSDDYNLTAHMKAFHNVKYFGCSVCTERFDKKTDWLNHMRDVHSLGVKDVKNKMENDFQCDFCSKRLSNRYCLQRHMAILHPDKKQSHEEHTEKPVCL